MFKTEIFQSTIVFALQNKVDSQAQIFNNEGLFLQNNIGNNWPFHKQYSNFRESMFAVIVICEHTDHLIHTQHFLESLHFSLC